MLTFETPSWVPPGVARLIEKLSEPDSTPVPVDPEVIRRLATDVRMRNVWAELTKKARDTDGTTGRAFHLGRLPDAVRSWGALAGAERAQSNRIGDLGDAEGAQAYKQLAEGMDFLDCMRAKPSIDSAQEHQLSLALLFLCTLSLYASNLTSVSKEEVEAWKQRELAAGNTSIAARSVCRADGYPASTVVRKSAPRRLGDRCQRDVWSGRPDAGEGPHNPAAAHQENP
jgi:hypothetical protein